MVIDNITLDQVREEQFDLRTIYEVNDIKSHEDHDSPFQQCNIDCDYYEPEELNRKIFGQTLFNIILLPKLSQSFFKLGMFP